MTGQEGRETKFRLENTPSDRITERQNGWVWKGPLEIIQSKLSAKAWSPEAGDTGIHPGGWSMSAEGDSKSSLSQCFATLNVRKFFLIWGEISYVFIFCSAPLRRAWHHPRRYLYAFMRSPLKASLLQAEEAQLPLSLLTERCSRALLISAPPDALQQLLSPLCFNGPRTAR